MGIFASCPPSESACFARLGVARGMGFELLLNMGGLASGPEAARQYAADAEALGMNIAWPLSDESWWLHFDPAGTNLLYAHQAWADACGCTDNQGLVEYVVSTLASFPNTWGWYAADDLSIRSPDRVDDVTAWTQRLKQLAPGTSTVIAVWDNLATYRDAADYVAQESYPFGLPRGLGSTTPLEDVAALARHTQRATPGRASFILQAFSWGDNMWDAQATGGCSHGETPAECLPQFRYPTAREQRQQRQTILLNSQPALMLWYGLPGTIGPYQPVTDPNYTAPTREQAALQMRSLSAAVTAPPPVTRACVQVHRRHRWWVLDAARSQALGGVSRLRWRHRGWRQLGRGLTVALGPTRARPAKRAHLTLRDRYARRVRLSIPLTPSNPRRTVCAASRSLGRW
jgi:hypothetical protein